LALSEGFKGLSEEHWTSLEQLPQGLKVDGNLYCNNCIDFLQLPERLSIHGGLYGGGCTNFTQLPAERSVGGSLYFIGCTGLTSLPNNITSWGASTLRSTREIDLFGSGIPPLRYNVLRK
jgi:hypothetical protein